MQNDGFKKAGLDSVWIDTISKSTTCCPFCELPQDLSIKRKGADYLLKCGHCYAEYQCNFTFGSKVKSHPMYIIKCGDVNIKNYQVGLCNANLIIQDTYKIKYFT